MIGAVLIANACAAVENAAQAGEWNVTVLVDGTFSVLAAGLFGVMALRLREVSAHTERLGQSG